MVEEWTSRTAPACIACVQKFDSSKVDAKLRSRTSSSRANLFRSGLQRGSSLRYVIERDPVWKSGSKLAAGGSHVRLRAKQPSNKCQWRAASFSQTKRRNNLWSGQVRLLKFLFDFVCFFFSCVQNGVRGEYHRREGGCREVQENWQGSPRWRRTRR